MKYLNEHQYYLDLYDLHTIEECLDWYFTLKKGMNEKRSELKDITQEEFDKDVHKAVSYTINVIKAERYRHRKAKIEEWMERDRKTQEKFDNATPPEEIYCKECFSRTKVTSKDLLGSSNSDEPVLFMFACIKCNKRQALYEDGTEWLYKPPECPQCNSPLKSDSIDKDDVSTTRYSCTNCSYTKTDTFDFKKSKARRVKKEERDKKLLAEFRQEFCYDDKVGPEAVMSQDNLVRFAKEMEEKDKKDKNPVYQKARQLKTLKIGQLKELLEKTVEKEHYQDLAFAKPDMGQFVIIDFSVNDMQEERKEYDSINKLKKLIKSTLEDTNWRLMSEGIHYRLGILTGRIKAYEKEDDLVKLVK